MDELFWKHAWELESFKRKWSLFTAQLTQSDFEECLFLKLFFFGSFRCLIKSVATVSHVNFLIVVLVGQFKVITGKHLVKVIFRTKKNDMGLTKIEEQKSL